MEHSEGAPLFSRLIRAEYAATNPGLVTCDNAGDDILSLDLGTLNLNELLLVNVRCLMEKLLVAGQSHLLLLKTGGDTGDLAFTGVGMPAWRCSYHNASTDWQLSATVFMKVTTAGTIHLRLTGYGFGSDFKVGATNGRVQVHVLRAV